MASELQPSLHVASDLCCFTARGWWILKAQLGYQCHALAPTGAVYLLSCHIQTLVLSYLQE